MTVKSLKHIKALTFDLDDTLWPLKHTLEQAEQAANDFLVAQIDSDDYDFCRSTLIPFYRDLIAQNPHLKCQLSTLRQRSYEGALLAAGLDASRASDLSHQALKTFVAARSDVQLYAGNYDSLALLKEKYTLGVITNGNASFEKMPVAQLFDFYISAEHVGHAKPDSAIFDVAFTRCKTANRLVMSPEEVLHIGDDKITDVFGANRFGFSSCWLYDGSKDNSMGHKFMDQLPDSDDPALMPDVQISCLKELILLLD